MRSPVIYTFFITAGPVLCFSQNTPVVNTPIGAISGIVQSSWRGTTFYSFRGIRYAEAPINDLRFKPPIPVRPWTGVFDGTKPGPACFQPPEFIQSLGASDVVSEDCLRINVYTRLITENTNLRPVFVYIHGGGFSELSGQAIFFGPEYLMEHDIVLVTLNYRLGSLGFFSTGDKYAPGNYGLKDQVQALKWVRDNIRYFGGNPDQVTIGGESAGAVSVGLHLISPMSRGLFHGAINFSGATANFWSSNKNPWDLAQKQANLLNCPTDDSQSMVNCIKNLGADEITNAYINLTGWRTEPVVTLTAVIENETDGVEPFLTKDPTAALMEGDIAQVPVFIGITKDEFSPRAYMLQKQENAFPELSQNWNEIAPIAFFYERNDDISLKLREYYFGNRNQPIVNDSVEALGRLHADAVVTFGVVRSAKLYADKITKPVYLYRFNYEGEIKGIYWPEDLRNTPGVLHGDELVYLFHASELTSLISPDTEDGRCVDRFTTLIKNFVTTLNPTPGPSEIINNIIWTPFTNNNPTYLEISRNLQMIPGLFYEDRMALWDSLFPLNFRRQTRFLHSSIKRILR